MSKPRQVHRWHEVVEWNEHTWLEDWKGHDFGVDSRLHWSFA